MRTFHCRLGFAIGLTIAASGARGAAVSPGTADSVDPFIGTAGGGNTFPAATLPFGMIQWGPDTRPDGWYHFGDRSIRGFSLTHISGAGCPVYADVPLLPRIGAIGKDDSPAASTSRFSHDNEHARPGLYRVVLDNGIEVELTTTRRAGIGRITFPAHVIRTILVKAGSSATADDPKRSGDTASVRIINDHTVVGTVNSGGFCTTAASYTLHYVLEFSKPFTTFGTWMNTVTPGRKSAEGHGAGAYVSFAPGVGPLLVKTGLSFVDAEGATANLRREIPGWDFASVRAAADREWSAALGRIPATGGTGAERTIFYTGLYHMLLSPNLFSDVDGRYAGFDARIRRLSPGEEQYANFSDWDTYRDVIQLHSLLFPGRTGQMMQSLIRDAEQSGCLPRWPVANQSSYVMSGDPEAILISDAYAFGARDFDLHRAKQIMVEGAVLPLRDNRGEPHRPGFADYLRRGHLPVSPQREYAASMTLEYTSADFAISRFAAAMGDAHAATVLLRSAQNWRTLIDPETGFIRPRLPNGKFLGGWDPDHLKPRLTNWDQADQLGFEEGSTWQYTWMVPYNVAGLIRALGGAGRVVPKLDRFFSRVVGWGVPTFTVTNEPDFGAPFVYLWLGIPGRTQTVIERIRQEAFTTRPDGLPGNDDLGATSGVYVWSALGLYPAIPGVGGFALGTPLFHEATLPLGEGRMLQIIAHGEGIYVQSVRLNGKPYPRSWLPLEALTRGENRLEFTLGTALNHQWATTESNRPPSFDAAGAP